MQDAKDAHARVDASAAAPSQAGAVKEAEARENAAADLVTFKEADGKVEECPGARHEDACAEQMH